MTNPTPELTDEELIDEATGLARLICPLPEEVDEGDPIERMPDDLLRSATVMGELCNRLNRRPSVTDPAPEDVERVAIALFLQNPNRNQALSWDHAATPKARYRNAAKAALAAMSDHSALIRELRDALTASDRLLGRKSGLTPAGQMLAVRACNEAALRKANEALGEKA